MENEEGTQFLNVDLDIFSRVPLDPIVEAFGKKVFVLHVGKWGRRYSAHVELSGSGADKRADLLVRRLVGLVKELPRGARRVWNEAESREFNLGIEAARRSQMFELRLQPETLEAVASVDGRIVITVYAPERLPPSASSGVRRRK
jgi:hypothetical protein